MDITQDSAGEAATLLVSLTSDPEKITEKQVTIVTDLVTTTTIRIMFYIGLHNSNTHCLLTGFSRERT